MDRSSKEEVAVVAAEALTQLTCTIVKAENCSASASNCSRNAKELHSKALHSVSKSTCQQDETAAATPVGGGPQSLGPVAITVESPRPCVLPGRQLSSSVDCPSSPISNSPNFSQVEAGVEDSLAVNSDSRPTCRPNSLSLNREASTTSSCGSGKTTPCNIPERTSSTLQRQESWVASYPPVNAASCYMSPMQRGAMAASFDRQNGVHLDSDMQAVERQMLARMIATKLSTIGDQISAEADIQDITDLLESIINNNSPWCWSTVARIFRALSSILAQCVLNETSTAWDIFADVWKHVLRNLFTLIANNGGWNSFIQWASSASNPTHPPHPTLPTSFTPDVSRRRNTIDTFVRYSTPQAPRRFPPNHSTPSVLPSAKGSKGGSCVRSLTEEGVFQMEGQATSFKIGERSSADQQQEDEEATFGSLSSFSDVSGSPTSINPPSGNCSLVESDLPCSSAFDRNRSRSFPTRTRPNSARLCMRRNGSDRTEAIAEREHSMDSGLEAFSEASLESADSCTSLHYSRLGVSATCILEAVRAMLLER